MQVREEGCCWSTQVSTADGWGHLPSGYAGFLTIPWTLSEVWQWGVNFWLYWHFLSGSLRPGPPKPRETTAQDVTSNLQSHCPPQNIFLSSSYLIRKVRLLQFQSPEHQPCIFQGRLGPRGQAMEKPSDNLWKALLVFNIMSEKLSQMYNVLAWSGKMWLILLTSMVKWIPVLKLLLHWLTNHKISTLLLREVFALIKRNADIRVPSFLQLPVH